MSQKSNHTQRYVSPRQRAQRTFELLNLRPTNALPWTPRGPPATDFGSDDDKSRACPADVEVTEAIREWEYGEYEGVPSPEIRRRRAEQGIPGVWNIWRDGCPGGE